jgi:predicted nucleic acid-binding protein
VKFYIDTSVIGGYFDEEFSKWTIPFFKQLTDGKAIAVISDLTIAEISQAPDFVRNLITGIPEDFIEIVRLNKEHQLLADCYIKEGALTKKFETDALHIAIATTEKVDSLVSWNFKHMVNFFRIRQYNSINLKYGHSIIDIRSPKEVTL